MSISKDQAKELFDYLQEEGAELGNMTADSFADIFSKKDERALEEFLRDTGDSADTVIDSILEEIQALQDSPSDYAEDVVESVHDTAQEILDGIDQHGLQRYLQQIAEDNKSKLPNVAGSGIAVLGAWVLSDLFTGGSEEQEQGFLSFSGLIGGVVKLAVLAGAGIAGWFIGGAMAKERGEEVEHVGADNVPEYKQTKVNGDKGVTPQSFDRTQDLPQLQTALLINEVDEPEAGLPPPASSAKSGRSGPGLSA